MTTGRGHLAIWAVAAALAALAAVRIAGAQDSGAGASVAAVETGRGAVPALRARRSDGGGERVYVHVAGRVRRPGLYRLAPGARVAVALERAGGPARGADLAAVNLAARVEDGQQVLVPRAGAPGTASGPAAGGAAPGTAGAAKLSLGSATPEQLDGLDGIGPTLAKRIVEYRDRHGGFRSVSDLDRVEGIGEKRMAALRKAVGP